MNRVVVTGYGVISPIGHSAQETWGNLLNGVSGVGPITLFDIANLPVDRAAEVKDFDPETVLPRKEVRRRDRFEWLAAASAKEALEHSGLIDAPEQVKNRIGTIISASTGGIRSWEDTVRRVHGNGSDYKKISAFTIPSIMTNGASGYTSIDHGLRGPTFTVNSACASGADGIGVALQFLRAGMVDGVLAGATEASLTFLGVGSFARIQAYSTRQDNTPSPFSADRDGLIMGEGSAVLMLETLEHAKARGASILAELIGYGSSADAYHITAPTEDGSGSGTAIKRAMVDAKIDPSDIDYISAHGTGTPLNDSTETRAIKYALGERAYDIPISSTKSMTGHMMGATAALEAVFSIQAIQEQCVPPTINYREPDPECDLDYVPNEAREVSIRTVMSNSFGFGGHNAVLIFRAFED
ncbi:MAG: beta-ketoacyl-ACP synthase II [Chloroflexi bacterium]|nr:beta-ketoacyl-ACP synthase II [Chloroflexota bacterium]